MKIAKLLEEATPRPWKTWQDPFDKTWRLDHKLPDNSIIVGVIGRENNAQLIPVLANSAPELIALVKAARMLYDDTMDYIRINNLGGENNHSIKAVREALAALNKHEAWREE